MTDNGVEPKEERSTFTRTWSIEWKEKTSQTVKTEQASDYPQALSLFNELSVSGKEAVLYEIRTPIADPSGHPKKIPILNSAQGKKRISRGEVKPRAVGMSERIMSASKSGATSSLRDLRTRILILIAVIAVFVIILFLISILFTSSELAHNFSLYTSSAKSFALGLDTQPLLHS